MTDERGIMDAHIITPEDFSLCTKRDDFIWDRPIWIATLEDNTEIWQDDDRPGIKEPSAWIRLGEYVKATGIKIKKLQLRFRTNIITIPKSNTYYFTRGIIGHTCSKISIHFACVGFMDKNNTIEVTWYKIPELIPTKRSVKSLDEIKGLELIQGVV